MREDDDEDCKKYTPDEINMISKGMLAKYKAEIIGQTGEEMNIK